MRRIGTSARRNVGTTEQLYDGTTREMGGALAPPFEHLVFIYIFKGLRPPAADPQQNEGMMLRGYENHEAIALVTCAS